MWKSGQRVFGQKGNDQVWYTGTVRHIDGERCYVIFDDGDDGFVASANLKPLELHPDDTVFARLPMDGEYKPAKVVAWDDEKVRVKWPSGDEDWTSFGMIRLQPESKKKVAVRGNVYAEGDRVFACWHDLFWYPGVVVATEADQYHILFDDGQQAPTTADRIKPLEFDVGDRIFCRWKGGPEYFPGEITERRGEVIHVNYDDGDDETTSIRLVRLQRDEWFPPSEQINFSAGDRVLGCWLDAHWYPGVVLSVDGKRLHVLFDDGDQGLLTPDKVRDLDIKVGDRVHCRYKGGATYHPGDITSKQGEVIHIQYDDGSEETTSIRLVRIASDSSADLRST
ncbi:MAG TPA: hypothetical protein VE988_08810 [Gemmataceae bacterium]|nr:hypothetical protein [Gemmataceae bacterium]